MAYDLNKLTKVSDLKALAQRAEQKYATKKSVTDLTTKVTELEQVGAQANVLEGVKVNGKALAIAEKMVDILIATGSANGTVSVSGVDVAVKGLAALAYKAEVSETELSAALKAVIDAKAEQTDVNNLQAAINTLNGTGDGSVSKQITDAFNDFSTKVTDDGVVNSYKELIDYAAEHGAEFTELVGKVTALTNLVGTLPEGAQSTTIVGYIAEAIAAIGIGDYAKTTEVTAAINSALEGYVAKEDGKRLMTNTEGEKLEGIAENATKTEASTTNGNVKINGVETKVYELPSDVIQGEIATDAEVAEMLAEVIPAV